MLNRVPEPYVPVTLGMDQSMGVGYTVKIGYEDFLDKDSETGTIEFPDEKTVTTTPRVVAMLKAILIAGCCRIEERSNACSTVFEACNTATSEEEFLKMADAIHSDNPFVSDIVSSIREVWADWT